MALDSKGFQTKATLQLCVFRRRIRQTAARENRMTGHGKHAERTRKARRQGKNEAKVALMCDEMLPLLCIRSLAQRMPS